MLSSQKISGLHRKHLSPQRFRTPAARTTGSRGRAYVDMWEGTHSYGASEDLADPSPNMHLFADNLARFLAVAVWFSANRQEPGAEGMGPPA